jgi:hypothetical protein
MKIGKMAEEKLRKQESKLPEVTTSVESSIAFIYRSIPYSSSANPCTLILS